MKRSILYPKFYIQIGIVVATLIAFGPVTSQATTVSFNPASSKDVAVGNPQCLGIKICLLKSA